MEQALGHIGPSSKKCDGRIRLEEVLKQFLGEPRGKTLSAAWDGDRYAVYEEKRANGSCCSPRATGSQALAERFFANIRKPWRKARKRSNLFRKPDFFSFDTPNGGVFLRCFETNASLWKEAMRSPSSTQQGNELAAVPSPKYWKRLRKKLRKAAALTDRRLGLGNRPLDNPSAVTRRAEAQVD